MNFKILKNRKQIEVNKNIIEFNFPIMESLEFEDYLVVLLEIPNGVFFYENVFGVNAAGALAWQIESVKEKEGFGQITPFMNLWKDKSNRVRISDYMGISYIIDPATGRILEKYLTK